MRSMTIGDPYKSSNYQVTLQMEYLIGDEVYHVADESWGKGIVTGYLVRATGLVYQVTWGNNRSEQGHFEFELTSERSI